MHEQVYIFIYQTRGLAMQFLFHKAYKLLPFLCILMGKLFSFILSSSFEYGALPVAFHMITSLGYIFLHHLSRFFTDGSPYMLKNWYNLHVLRMTDRLSLRTNVDWTPKFSNSFPQIYALNLQYDWIYMWMNIFQWALIIIHKNGLPGVSWIQLLYSCYSNTIISNFNK